MLARVKNHVLDRMTRRKYAPAIKVEKGTNLRRLGSHYGGWTFEPSSDLKGATLVSCGLGEDASFDVEIAAAFAARVILVDPTPRAIAHFEEIRSNFGQAAASGYSKGGKQPADAYELRAITADSLVLEPSALWIENTRLKFFAPSNSEYVSHSIVNPNSGSSASAGYIEVNAITLETLIDKYRLSAIPLMKIDIEGAEGKVIESALAKCIYPRQLLVEFDEMNLPSEQSQKIAEATDLLLRQAGYACRYFDGMSNFLYTRS